MHNFGAVDGMRVRVLPVLGTMPAIMGQALAAVAGVDLGGQRVELLVDDRHQALGNRLGAHGRGFFHANPVYQYDADGNYAYDDRCNWNRYGDRITHRGNSFMVK